MIATLIKIPINNIDCSIIVDDETLKEVQYTIRFIDDYTAVRLSKLCPYRPNDFGKYAPARNFPIFEAIHVKTIRNYLLFHFRKEKGNN